MLGTDGSICDALNLESSDKLRSDGNLVGAGKNTNRTDVAFISIPSSLFLYVGTLKLLRIFNYTSYSYGHVRTLRRRAKQEQEMNRSLLLFGVVA